MESHRLLIEVIPEPFDPNHWLTSAEDREVSPHGVALPIGGHNDPPQVRVASEGDPKHIIDLPL
jgi:hypothetical protein